ncbi:Acetyltransferase (GNAT) family protein [Actinomyces ruminicola]|uniref:Acetyltransferase (GNAT) family protein n=1 Tax=Actinomyces ruminicola TaxID=332524 RepID=A0A1G9ZAS5_9ACTO|nr:Acetyltransferase (GNAT) family protein [Actinomyces ruminicola]
MPATRFEDVATLIGPRKPTSNVCFCLSHRLGSAENNALRGPARAERVRQLCAEEIAPGVIAYLEGEPIGWAAVHPRSRTSFARSRRIPNLDELAVWSLWCLRVRPGYRRRGVTHHLIEGAAEYARTCGAPAVEAYPVDNGSQKVDPTMAYVGTRSMFERAGFHKAGETASVLNGFPRVLMRRDLGSR